MPGNRKRSLNSPSGSIVREQLKRPVIENVEVTLLERRFRYLRPGRELGRPDVSPLTDQVGNDPVLLPELKEGDALFHPCIQVLIRRERLRRLRPYRGDSNRHYVVRAANVGRETLDGLNRRFGEIKVV